MSSDDRLRQAFEDLERRAERVDPQFSLQRLPRTTERRGWIPALAGAGAVLAVIGVVALSGFLSGPDDDIVTGTTTDNTETTTAVPSTTTPFVTTTWAPFDDPQLLAPTHRVTGVADDDVLNVRREPGAGSALYAALPPDYAGIRLVDNVAVVEDGGEWWQVELLDPVRLIDRGEPLEGAPIVGWVNSAFLAEYDPSLPEVEPCAGEVGSVPTASGTAPDHTYSLRQFMLDGGCVRTVVTFGQNFDEFRPQYDGISTDVRPAGTPALRRETVNGTAVLVLEGVPYAWATQSGTFQSSVALVGRWTDNHSLAIYLTVPGSTSVRVAETGQLVIDVTPLATSGPSGNGFHLLGAPVVGAGGTLEVWGLARPFEANIGTTVLLDGNGTDIGPPYVMTNDWTDAWGLFQYRAVGLTPGEYLLTLVQEGADQGIELAVPFAVEGLRGEPITDSDLAITDALRGFARGSVASSEVRFADTVAVSLGNDHESVVLDVNDPAAWVIDADEWNGYGGPFDVLGPLRSEAGITVTLVGPQLRCAGPTLETPVDWVIFRQLSIQPAGITSCLEWYSIEVFLDAGGDIERIRLDLWEP
jgi:hypothetical protein